MLDGNDNDDNDDDLSVSSYLKILNEQIVLVLMNLGN